MFLSLKYFTGLPNHLNSTNSLGAGSKLGFVYTYVSNLPNIFSIGAKRLFNLGLIHFFLYVTIPWSGYLLSLNG